MDSSFNAEFVREAARSGVRQDGRSVVGGSTELEIRLIRGSSGVAVAEVWAEETGSRVLSRVTCSLVVPESTRPVEGRVSVTVDALSSRKVFVRPHWIVELEQLVTRVVKGCEMVDREALCVVAGHWVWSVRCDVHVLSRQGNVGDAAVLAAVAALRHARRGKVDVVPDRNDDVAVRSIDDAEPQRLPLMHLPLCATLAILDASDMLVVVDPTRDEETAAQALVSIALTPNKQLCAFHKVGGAAIDSAVLLACLPLARSGSSVFPFRYVFNLFSFTGSASSISRPSWLEGERSSNCVARRAEIICNL